MNERGDQGVIYSAKEMFERIERLLESFDHKLDAATEQLQLDRSSTNQRLIKLEEALTGAKDARTELASMAKQFIGFEQRFALHEVAMSHPSALAQTATLLLDVEQLKSDRATRVRMEDYVKQVQTETRVAAEHADDRHRWVVGLMVAVVFNSLSLLFLLVRSVGFAP